MRFFKIFLVVFFSLIGVIAATVGVMYVTGAIDKQKISPESIYFEYSNSETEYNLDQDTYVTIKTITEDVTETTITLSLPGDPTPMIDDNGVKYITDSIITVPQKVQLNQPFKITLNKSQNQELGGIEWINGGQTKLTATSESQFADPIHANVNIDVPVYSISVTTHQNTTEQAEQSIFAYGETLIAKANFVPVDSQYKYSKTNEFKSVYFDISGANQCVSENIAVKNAINKANVTAFDVIQSSSETQVINAYVFSSARNEKQYDNGNIEQILNILKTTSVGVSTNINSTPSLTFTKRSVGYFSIPANSTPKTLKFNTINYVYANYGLSDSDLNLGINIGEGEDLKNNLQNKIRDVGIQVWINEGNPRPASSSEYIIVDDNGDEIKSGNALYKDDYILPNVVEAYVNRSYWNIVPCGGKDTDKNFFFKIKIFASNSENDIDDLQITEISTANYTTLQSWTRTDIVATAFDWNTDEDISLTVIDNVNPTEVQSDDINLDNLLTVTQKGTYREIKYLAFVSNTSTIPLTSILSSDDIVKTTLYDLALSSTDLYELNTPIIKPIGSGTFYVYPVIVKTNHNGKAVVSGDGKYEIYNYQTPSELTVKVGKTVRSVEASLEVSNKDLLKNYNAESTGVLEKLAFGTHDSIFDLVITVSGQTKDDLDKEVQLFINDFNNNKFSLNQTTNRSSKYPLSYNFSQITDSEDYYNYTLNQWQYRIPISSGVCSEDIEITLGFVYEQLKDTFNEQKITSVKFTGELEGVEFINEIDSIIIEIYDEKIESINFAYANTSETALTQELDIGEGDSITENLFYATSCSQVYKLNGEIVDGVIYDGLDDKYKGILDIGDFLIIAKDKYGNEINIKKSDYFVTLTNDGAKVSAINYSSVLAEQGLVPFDNLYFTSNVGNENQIIRVGKNIGKYSNGKWHTENIANGFTEVQQDQQNRIELSRIGTKNGEIQITGNTGLLSVHFKNQVKNQDSVYELCNILNYEFTSSIQQFIDDGVFSYENGTLTINKTLGTAITLYLSASTGIGVSYPIQLTITPNVSVEFKTSGEVETIGDTKYFKQYSDSEVKYDLAFTFNAKESITIKTNYGLLSIEGSTTKTNTIVIDATEDFEGATKTINLSLFVDFPVEKLNEQKITIFTYSELEQDDPKTYDFSVVYNFLISGNVRFVNKTNLIEKNIIIQNFANTYTILTNDDIERIVTATKDLSVQDVTLSFEKYNSSADYVFEENNEVPLAQNIFELTANKIQCTDIMYGNYIANVVVKYGSNQVGIIKINISTNIQPNESNADYDKFFTTYNNKLSVNLVSGKEYNTTDIKNLFIAKTLTNIEEANYTLEISIPQNSDITLIGEKYHISELFQYKDNYSITITNKYEDKVIANITFPIILSPFEINYITYENEPAFANDFSKLNSDVELRDAEVYDSYLSGSTINLYTNTISSSLQTLLKNGYVSCSRFIEDKNGLISNVSLKSNFDKKTGELKIEPYLNDFYAYLVFTNSSNERIGLYRIKVIRTLALNIYYPYEEGAFDNKNELSAEYVYEGLKDSKITIDFTKDILIDNPNSGHKRVVLEDVLSNGSFSPTTKNYTFEYSLNIPLNIMLSDHSISLNNGKLEFISNGKSEKFEIIVTCTAKIDNKEVGSVDYIIKVNSGLKSNYSLYSLVTTEEISGTTLENYSEYKKEENNSKIIDSSSTDNTYNYSKILLWNLEDGQVEKTVKLQYYYYIDGKDVSSFISETNKEIALNSSAVSDKNVTFIYYTIYGEVYRVNLKFLTNFSVDLNTESVSVVTKEDNKLTVDADTEFALNNTFDIKDSNAEIIKGINAEYYSYKVYDNSECVFEGNNLITFPQIVSTTKTYRVVMEVALQEFNSTLYHENLIYEFEIVVKKSIFAKESVNLGEVKYNPNFKTSGYNINIVSIGSEDLPFKAINSNVLNGYTLSISTEVAETYLNVGTTSVLLQNVTSNYIWNLIFNCCPPDQGLQVNLTFTLSKGEVSFEVDVYFKLLPDLFVNLNYPQANETTKFDNEKLYLASDCITKSLAQNTFGEEYISFKLSSAGYFNNNRIELNNKGDSAVALDTNRLTISVISTQATGIEGKIGTIVVKNNSNYNTNISNVAYDSEFNIEWLSADEFQSGTIKVGEVKFKIMIDGIERGIYKLILCNDMSAIFNVSNIKNLKNILTNNPITENSIANYETFYVENADSEQIFSHNTAILTLQNKAQNKTTPIKFYLKDSSGSVSEVIGEGVITSNIETLSWLLIANEEITLDKLIVKVEKDENEYSFNLDASNELSAYNKFFNNNQNTTNLQYRMGITYQNKELSYENYSLLTADEQSLVDYSFSLKDKDNIETQEPIEVIISANGEPIGIYYYKLIYDFKIEQAYSQTNTSAIKTLYAPNSLSVQNEIDNESEQGAKLFNKTFGISGYTGNFDLNYFKKHKLYYNAEVILITNTAFENYPTWGNVTYLQEGKVKYITPYFSNLTKSKDSSSILCVKTTEEIVDNVIYDFNIAAFGAENNGNYAYILITYGATESIATHALVKIKVNPNQNSIELKNYNSDNQFAPNSKNDNPFIIKYNNDNIFDEIILGTHKDFYSNKNLIFVRGNSTEENPQNLICETSINSYSVSLTVCGEIDNYVTLNKLSDKVSLVQKNNSIALYGDKTGYIHVEDNFGYYKDFYIVIEAKDINKLSIPDSDYDPLNPSASQANGPFINFINGENNAISFYMGTIMQVVDAESTTPLVEMGGIRIVNLNKLNQNRDINGWSYSVSYSIPEVNFSKHNELDGNTTFEIPTLSSEFYNSTLTLNVEIDIQHDNVQEKVVLSTKIIIVKRFSWTTDTSKFSSVQDGTAFDVSNFLSVRDEANSNEENKLGDAKISGNVVTLRIDASAQGKAVSLDVQHKNGVSLEYPSIPTIKIIVGKDFNNQDMTAINGYYYYILATYPTLSPNSIDYSAYKFTLSSTAINVDVNCEFVADKIVYLTTSNLTTSTNTPDDVYVHINNGETAYAIPFSLNRNGVQSKSLREVIDSGKLKTSIGYEDVDIATDTTLAIGQLRSEDYSSTTQNVVVNSDAKIYSYVKSSTPVTASDLQKIRNFEIYNDTLILLIKEGYKSTITQSGISFQVEVFDGSERLGIKEYSVEDNGKHYRYIKISEIVGTNIDLTENKNYKVVVSYEVDSAITNIIAHNIIQIGYIENNTIKLKTSTQQPYKSTPTSKTFKVEFNEFRFTKLTIENPTDSPKTELIQVPNSSVYANNLKIYNVSKYYLVKYSNHGDVESAEVPYKVTPKYYGIDNENDPFGNAGIIYANQYTVSQIGGELEYFVNFATWASPFNLIDYDKNILASLNNGEDIEFTFDGGSGSKAELDVNNNLKVKGNIESRYVTINVKVKVSNNENDNDLIPIGSVVIHFSPTEVYVSNLATYRVVVTHPSTDATEGFDFEFTQNANPATLTQMFYNNSIFTQDPDNPKIKYNEEESYYQFKIGEEFYKLKECNIEVITLIDEIYSVAYQRDDSSDYLELKLKISEKESSKDQAITLKVDATDKHDKTSTASQKLEFQIVYEDGEYKLEHTLSGVKSEKDSLTDIYTIKIPFVYFSTGIIGEDYNYSAVVFSTKGTGGAILFADRPANIELVNNDIIIFALNFTDNSTDTSSIHEHYTLLAIRYDQANSKNYGTDKLFSVNISNFENATIDNFVVLQDNISQMKRYTLTYVTKYSESAFKPSHINYLLTISDINKKYYSIVQVLNYISSKPYNAFEIKLNSMPNSSQNLLYQKIVKSNSAVEKTFTKYTDSINTKETINLPSKVVVESNATANTLKWYNIYSASISSAKIVGVMLNNNGDIELDLSEYIKDENSEIIPSEYITVENYVNKVIAFALNEFITLSNGAITYWQFGGTGNSKSTYGKTILTKTTNAGQNTYLLSTNYMLTTTQITQVATMNLTNLVNSASIVVNENNYYTFKVEFDDKINYISIKGSELNNCSFNSIFSSLGITDKFTITFMSNVENTTIGSGIKHYAIYQNTTLKEIYAVEYASVATNIFKTTVNPLHTNINTRAVQIDTSNINLTINDNNKAIKIITKNSSDSTISEEYYYVLENNYNLSIPFTLTTNGYYIEIEKDVVLSDVECGASNIYIYYGDITKTIQVSGIISEKEFTIDIELNSLTRSDVGSGIYCITLTKSDIETTYNTKYTPDTIDASTIEYLTITIK